MSIAIKNEGKRDAGRPGCKPPEENEEVSRQQTLVPDPRIVPFLWLVKERKQRNCTAHGSPSSTWRKAPHQILLVLRTERTRSDLAK